MRFFSTLIASVLGTLVAFALIFVFGTLIFSAMIASFSSLGATPTPAVESGSVLVMNLSGPIAEQSTQGSPFDQLLDIPQITALDDIKQSLANAAEDSRISAVWLRPSGVMAGWATLGEIREALIAFKASGKPLIASGNGLSIGEAGYFLASAADSIYSPPEAFFEFNGFYLGVSFYKGLLDKLNIEPTVLRSGKFKGAVEPYMRRNLSEENRLQLQAILDNRYDWFTHTVAESRNMNESEVTSLMSDGTLITANDAHKAGLLDALLYEDEIKTRLQQTLDTTRDLKTVSLDRYRHVRIASSSEKSTDDAIAVVYAVGAIMGGKSSSYQGRLGSSTFINAMKRARENSRVKAVVVRINSPGGTSAASDAIWRAITLTTKEKPVIVSMGDVAASGGYWLATAADSIVVSPQTLTGSIGVFGIHLNLGRMMDTKLGITSDQVSTGPYADMFSSMRPLGRREQLLLERAIDETYTRFLEKVATSRGMDVEEVDTIAQGRVWTGNDALKLGLADVEGGLDDAIHLAAQKAGLEKDQYYTIQLPRPTSIFDEITDSFLLHVKAFFESPWETELRKQARLLEELSQMQHQPIVRLPWDIQMN